MNTFSLAARNLWRNTRRTLITVFGIAGGLGLMLFSINFQQGSYNQSLNNALRMMAGHIVLAVLLGFISYTAASVVWWGVAPASVLGATALSLLELFVAFLQAYIFVFLTSLFIGSVVHPH